MNESYRNTQAAPWLEGVDAFRLIAIVGVVAIHTTPVLDPAARRAGEFDVAVVVVNQLARVAVPFFFTVSGYFWGRKIHAGAAIGRTTLAMVRRLLLLYVVWSLFYLLPYNLASISQYGIFGPLKLSYWNARHLVADPGLLLLEGTHQHLWFLAALAWAVALTGALVAWRRTTTLVILAVSLYVFGIAAYAYAQTPLGVSVPFCTRDGPFFGTVFFVTGYLLSGLQPRSGWLWRGAMLLAAGCALHFLEVIYLWRWYHAYPLEEYVFGTYLMGVGAAVMALSDHPGIRWSALARLGPATLGVYLVNPIFSELLEPVGQRRDVIWQLSHLAAVLALSLLTVLLLSRSRYLRWLVLPERRSMDPGGSVLSPSSEGGSTNAQ